MMGPAAVLLALVLTQSSSAPYLRSHVDRTNTQSQCLFWTTPTLTWNLNSAGNPASVDAQKQREFDAIRASFQSWQRVFSECGNLNFVEGPLVDERSVGYVQNGENHNLVLFRSRRCRDLVPSNNACWSDESCGNAYDCWDSDERTIALTLTTYDERSGIIYDSDIQLNSNNFIFTTVASPPCSQPVSSPNPNCVATDVQNTMTHELGHLIGLDHTLLSSSVMYPQAPAGETSKRTIDQGSRDFVCLAYPKGRASQSCFTPTLVPSSGSTPSLTLGKEAAGCSSTGGGGAGLVLLALLGGLGVRRRRVLS